MVPLSRCRAVLDLVMVSRFQMTVIGKKWQSEPSPGGPWEMKDDGKAERDIADVAFERAWSVYRLINSNIDEHDERRATLDRFIRKRCAAGATDAELVVVEALKFLKRLDGFGGRD
jgi:hypothetical protein